MVICKISGVYHKRQRSKWYPITPFVARKLVSQGAKIMKEIK
jgi:hypothetical protein